VLQVERMSGFGRFGERLLAALLLCAAAPILLVTALAIRLTDFGPALFRQTRAGLYGRPFLLFKFRSMFHNNRPLDSPEEIGESDPLVTPVGRWIRRLKIDEAPQLINVVRGEMALVGPRPTVMEQIQSYTPFQRRRLEVLPGMTGWAQVNGGAELSWGDRILLEVWYVKHRSLLLDLKILSKTVAVILFGHKPDLRPVEVARRFALQAELGAAAESDGGLSVSLERLHSPPSRSGDCGLISNTEARMNPATMQRRSQ
jgi:lipopolysaccharide/colanic/teichoic acid biosynthesis glycosyltransferase